MALARPAARITIDGRGLTMPEAAAVSIDVALTLTGDHDRAELVLGPLSPWLDIAAGARAELELGHATTVAVLSGTVERVRHLPWGTLVDVLGPTALLEHTRVGRAYTGQTVGDIVRELISAAGAQAGDIDAGPTLGVYHVDERRSCWRHVRTLAAMFAYELSSGAGGDVHVRPPRTGRADHTLRAGAELVSWAVGTRQLGQAPAEVGPFGAASEQGAEAWSLVHHQPGGSGVHRVLPAVRDREAASAVDQAVAAAHERTAATGRVVSTGQPKVRAGDLVELDGVERAGATYRVRRARHRIDSTGFRTALDVEAA
jgi:phage protein D